MERLRSSRKKTVGTKQTLKAVEKGTAQVVYAASDAESQVIRGLLQTCENKGIPVIMVETMAELGRACGIDVGSASAAVLDN